MTGHSVLRGAKRCFLGKDQKCLETDLLILDLTICYLDYLAKALVRGIGVNKIINKDDKI